MRKVTLKCLNSDGATWTFRLVMPGGCPVWIADEIEQEWASLTLERQWLYACAMAHMGRAEVRAAGGDPDMGPAGGLCDWAVLADILRCAMETQAARTGL